jgi:hypothetical protein
MKLELKHLAPYLPYELKYKFNNTIYYYQHCSTREFDYENSRPILRPLSDLQKEIEVNGEKFVPQKKMPYLDFDWLITSVNPQEFVMKNNYEDILKLFEWHFDIFGLIKNGLAIDINTL